MWIDTDALFTEPLFRLGNVFWRICDFFVPTGIHWKYASLGGVNSSLGLPATSETVDDQGRAVQKFENGTIFWKNGRCWVEHP